MFCDERMILRVYPTGGEPPSCVHVTQTGNNNNNYVQQKHDMCDNNSALKCNNNTECRDHGTESVLPRSPSWLSALCARGYRTRFNVGSTCVRGSPFECGFGKTYVPRRGIRRSRDTFPFFSD